MSSAEYLAIARQWRPQTFEDLVGQAHVIQTLRNAIAHNRVSHAYLFSGPRGIGKTSVARVFAKALRCPNGQGAIPCNTCSECVAIAEARSVDVAEIDGASNNGVEAVRSLRDNVIYGATTGKYRIYIIDEVHMLSLSAFNALLKTLEEPPPHVIFVFATTEAHKIPLTILSRCQRFEFRRLTGTQITERLSRILQASQLQMAEDGLRLIAQHADGSLRDALSLLDQVISYHAGVTSQLSEAQVVEALGISGTAAVRRWVGAVVRKNVPAILKEIEEAYLAGVDLKHFAERSLEDVRRLYLLALARDAKDTLTAEALDLSGSHFAELEALAKTLPVIQAERMAQILMQATSQLGWAALPRFVLEMAGVRMSELDGLDQIETWLKSAPAAAVEPRTSAPPTPSFAPAPPPIGGVTPQPPAPVARPPQQRPSEPLSPAAQSWKGFVESVMKKRPLLGALLSHANFRVDGDGPRRTVILAFAPGSFYERQANEQGSRETILKMAREYFGPTTEISVSSSLNDTNASLERIKEEEATALKKRAVEHPTVLQVKEAMGADIVDIKVPGA